MWVNLEPTNVCQLDCLFCSRQLSKRPLGYLDLSVAATIFQQMAQWPGAALRLAGWGEPSLHPQIGRLVAMIKSQGIKLKIYTNGLALTPELMDLLIDWQVEDLQFSLQGLTPEQYELNRRRASYKALEEKIIMASERRGSRKRPFLSLLTSVLADELNQADPVRFTQRWLNVVDKVAVDLTNLNFVRESPKVIPHLARQSPGLTRGLCVEVFLALEIKYDGSIQFCGQDAQGRPEHTIGNVRDLTLEKAWLSPAMAAKRESVGRRLEHAKSPVCQNCYHNTTKYELFKSLAPKEPQ
jgi:MoaA/NifB/PqqE/SkfB family radical SAM enzyme